jgi:hypothetical protein
MSAVIILVSVRLPCIALAADPPASKSSAAVYSSAPATTTWKAAVRAPQPDAAVLAQDSELNIRVYEGFGTLGPVYGHRHPAYGIDVQARMETCRDGNTRISGLNIGGWNYQLSGSCEDAEQGASVAVRGRRPDQTAAPAEPESDSSTGRSTVIRCDPATWNCRTLPR